MRLDAPAELINRLLEAINSGTGSELLDPDLLATAHRLERMASTPEPLYVLGHFHWRRHVVMGANTDGEDLTAAIRCFTPLFLLGEGRPPEPLLPVLAETALPTATELLHRVLGSADTEAISRVLELWRRITDATPAEHPDRLSRLSEVGVLLSARHEHAGTPDDLDEAVQIGRYLVARAPGHGTYLHNLGFDLRTRYRVTGAHQDLAEAITYLRAAVDATAPGDPRMPSRLHGLYRALYRSSEITGGRAELDETILVIRTLLALTSPDDPLLADRLADLSVALSARHRLRADGPDLAEAIALDLRVLDIAGPFSPKLATYYANLGVDLRTRHGETGAGADLTAAIEAFRAGAAAAPAGGDQYISLTGDLAALLTHTGDAADLTEAIDLSDGLLADIPAAHPFRPELTFGLSQMFKRRFTTGGPVADLDRAIALGRLAVAGTPAGDPDEAVRWSTLCAALFQRYELTAGALGDLEEAVDAGHRAVAAALPADARRPVHHLHLACALHIRHQRTGRAGDLARAVSAARAAVRAAADGDRSVRAACLADLAYFLRSEFLRSKNPDVLDEAIGIAEEAVRTCPEDARELPICLEHLAICLTARCRHTLTAIERVHDPAADLDRAIQLERRALRSLPADDPRMEMFSINLATALSNRFQFFSDSPADLAESVATYTEVSELPMLTPFLRISAKRNAARLAASVDPRLTARLLAEAVRLLPEAAPREQDRPDQQHSLGPFDGLASMAAAWALTAGPGSTERRPPGERADAERAAAALELLELGRAVLISQTLDTRSDLTDLAAVHPELAGRFAELRALLDAPDGRETGTPLALDVPIGRDTGPPARPSPAARDRRQLGTRLRELIETIREQDGFASFMAPPALAELTRQAEAGPIAVVNVAGERADALIVRPDGVTHLPLPGLRYTELVEQVAAFRSALASARTTATGSAEYRTAQGALFAVLKWLWDAVAGPVLDELALHGELDGQDTGGGSPPRLWWAPGGMLASLPLHAAGHHREEAGEPPRTVLDRVVSSYVPTIRALRYARDQAAPSATAATEALVVAMSATPEAPDLTFAAAEAELVRTLVPGARVLSDGDATRASVLRLLDRAELAHFACHGRNDPADPSRSHLLLEDHRRSPLTIAALASVRLDRARLAYLSACETAIPAAPELLDEFINLATAFQSVGFPHVVGTLWEVNDLVAAGIAETFYSALCDGGAPDTVRTPYALHAAVRRARAQVPGEPSRWAAYVHVGA